MKGKRISRCLIILSGILMILPAALAIWTAETETLAHYTPTCAREDLLPILRKEQPDEAGYAVLFEQTGLAKAGVDELYASGQQWKLLGLQERYLAEAEVECDCGDFFIRSERLTNFSELIYGTDMARAWEASVSNIGSKESPVGKTVEPGEDSAEDAACVYGSNADYLEAAARGAASGEPTAFYFMPTVQTGDILITFSGHIFGWRSGHAAIVVDAGKHLTLEAVMPGCDSTICSLDDWQEYPGFALLRLKDASRQEREAIAAYAQEYLTGLPYRLTAFTKAGGFDESGMALSAADGEPGASDGDGSYEPTCIASEGAGAPGSGGTDVGCAPTCIASEEAGASGSYGPTCTVGEKTGRPAGTDTESSSAAAPLAGTQCAHLVWYAYRHFGYDLDSDGGFVVTPEDLYRSDLLELVQIYGLNPD